MYCSREHLRKLLQEAVRVSDEPEFRLSSGAMSRVYIDCRQPVLSALGHTLVGTVLAQTIKDRWGLGTTRQTPVSVGGVVAGGCPLASAVSMKSDRWDAFYVRKEPKDHGVGDRFVGTPTTKDVVLLEDVITTGGSVLRAAAYVKSKGFNVLGIVALVDRGGSNYIREAGYPVTPVYWLDEGGQLCSTGWKREY